MPILRYFYCLKCDKDTLFKYIPLLTLDNSYWKCPLCDYKIYKNFSKINEGNDNDRREKI
jgi:DNA-directed RNA polymerase subunit RPC12/RpoP